MYQRHWFVLRDLKRTNAKESAYVVLSRAEYGLERVFTPLVTKEMTIGGKKVVRSVPFVSDLLFVYASRAELDPIVGAIPTLQYRYCKGGAQNAPMQVRDGEMDAFLRAVSRMESPQYYTPDELPASIFGKPVRVVGGACDGIEGYLLSRKGSKKKRVVISVQGLLSAAVEVQPEYIQLLK